MRICAIVQARLGSTRLKNKVLLPLCGKPMLWHIIERVKRAALVDEVVVAYPSMDSAELKPIVMDAGAKNCPYDEDENDLVGRYLWAAKMFQADLIVRICADNPCVQPEYIDEAVQLWRTYPLAFYSNTTVGVQGRWMDGLGAEVFSRHRLQWLDMNTAGVADYREHPHRLFYDQAERHPEWFGFPVSAPVLRLDVNTEADYEFITDIYEHIYPTHPQFTIEDVLAYLKTKEVSHA